MTTEVLFTNYYRKNTWLSKESRSGLGSELKQTREIIKQLPLLIKQFNIKSLLDIPCGDFNWMQHVDLGCAYIGADIVKELIEENKRKYNKTFVHLDLLTSKLPKVDLILCRDCLVHFSVEDV